MKWEYYLPRGKYKRWVGQKNAYATIASLLQFPFQLAMPDKDGKLTPEDQKKIHDWLGQFPPALGENSPCPICGSSIWIIGEHLVQPVTLGPNRSVQLGGLAYPQIMLISIPCGYTRFINAVMIGLVPPAPNPEMPK